MSSGDDRKKDSWGKGEFMRFPSTSATSFALTCMLALVGPVVAKADEISDAVMSAQLCLKYVETGKVDLTRLQKEGFVRKSKSAHYYTRTEKIPVYTASGNLRSHKKVKTGSFRFTPAKNAKSFYGSECSFTGIAPDQYSKHRAITDEENLVFATFVTIPLKQGYKFSVRRSPRKFKNVEMLSKGNVLIEYSGLLRGRRGVGRTTKFTLTRVNTAQQ
jgi:hypothetical protein